MDKGIYTFLGEKCDERLDGNFAGVRNGCQVMEGN